MQEVINPYGFIYITTNLINGKRYIGQKAFLNTSDWKSYLGSGKLLKQAIKKYGKQKFARDIIAIAFSKEELNTLEISYIKNYNAIKNNNFYNIAEGGYGNTLKGLSEEEIKAWKLKMSQAHIGLLKGERHPMYGKHQSNYVKQIISKANKGRSTFQGRKHTQFTKQKMSNSKKGLFGEKNSHSKKVICINTGEIFPSLSDACKRYEIGKSNLVKCCKGKQKTCGNLQWMYYDDYLKISA